MPNQIELRPATQADFLMARSLYFETMKPLASEVMTWDDVKQSASFAEQWDADNVEVILLDGRSVGWIQAAQTSGGVFLQQMFISPSHQRQGIGTEVLRRFLDRWQDTGRPIVLTVLKNNPARRLYERHGFKVVGEVGVKFEMRRDA